MTQGEAQVTVFAPLVDTNEPESQVVEVAVELGQKVEAGDLLCVLETTKSTLEVYAESDGYVRELYVLEGNRVSVGDVICVIGATPISDGGAWDARKQPEKPDVPEGLRITRPARDVAQQLGVKLDDLPRGMIVTENVVRSMAEDSKLPAKTRYPQIETAFDETAVVIFGGGGRARTAIDLLKQIGSYVPIGIVDDNLPIHQEALGIPVLGGRDILPNLFSRRVRLAINAVGSVTDFQPRIDVFVLLADLGYGFPTLIHPRAAVEPSARIGAGVHISALAYLGSAVEVGFGVTINTGAIVSHDSKIGDYSHIAPGAILAGNVAVGRGVLVGMGVTTSLGISIGDGARIGNGADLHRDVPDGAIVRAGTSWPSR
jgi:sugar O-acyltransferase (sialic acid O-acetyltransferase NeuD family)